MFRKTIALAALLTIIGLNTNIALADETENQDVRFERHSFTVERQHGIVYFDGVGAKHPTIDHAQHIALITAFDGIAFESDRDVLNWVRKLHGPRTYTYDKVIRKDDQGIEVETPLVLLPAEERPQIDPLWNRWLDEQLEAKRVAEQQQLAYESEQSRHRVEREATEQLVAATRAAANSLALASGETSLWEVELIPQGSGTLFGVGKSDRLSTRFVGYTAVGVSANFGAASYIAYSDRSRFVRVYGRSSSEALSQASSANPGFQVGTIRKLAGY